MSSLAVSASARGMAADSSSARQMKKTTKTYVYKTDSDGNVTSHTDVQVSGSSMSESGEAVLVSVTAQSGSLYSLHEEIRGADPCPPGGLGV